MKKEYKYILIGFAGLLILLAVFFYLRYKNLKAEIETAPKQTAPTSSNTSTTTTVLPYHGIDTSKWKKGEQLHLLSGTVNIYKTPTASTAGILKTVNYMDQFITPFAAFESIALSGWVAVKYVSVNYLGFASIVTGYIYSPSNKNVSN